MFKRKDKREERRETRDDHPSSIIPRPSASGPKRLFRLVTPVFRALRVCAVAFVFVSGSLWLAWAVQSTFTQGDWSAGLDGGSNATQTGWTKYGVKDSGVDVSAGNIKLQSTLYTATDDGTLTTTGSATGGGAGFGGSGGVGQAGAGVGAAGSPYSIGDIIGGSGGGGFKRADKLYYGRQPRG